MDNMAELIATIADLAYQDPDNITPDSPLFSAGVIDSMALLELVVYIEKRFKIKIVTSELSLDNFDSPRRIIAFIDTKTAR